jgi:hypothetical protein
MVVVWREFCYFGTFAVAWTPSFDAHRVTDIPVLPILETIVVVPPGSISGSSAVGVPCGRRRLPLSRTL